MTSKIESSMQSDDPLDTIENFMLRISIDTCENIVDEEKIN
jgi:hypothetical protein